MKSRYSPFLLYLLLLSLTGGCASPERARERADRNAQRIIGHAQTQALGSAQPFTLERPSDTLRRELMLTQGLPSATNAAARPGTNGTLVLSFADALQIGARNNNEYQDLKEGIFSVALALDLQQYAFDTSLSGVLTGTAESDTTAAADVNKADAGFTTGISRKLANGATLAGNLTLNVVKLLTGDRETSYGLALDTTITVPLLRGAGREIVTAPLTQAERDVLYAILLFERHRTSFAVQVARGYLDVLQARERVVIAGDSLERLEERLRRADQLARAGRLPGTQLDQTHQDVLRARSRLISARQKVESSLDGFKATLGLPIDARIDLDAKVLQKLTDDLSRLMQPDPEQAAHREEDALRAALTQRLDLKVAVLTVEDAQRSIRVAANALKAGLDLRLTGTTAERRYRGGTQADVPFGDGTYAGGVNVDLPWNRREERNAYRETLIDLDRAQRALEQKEDSVKKEVRDAIRSLQEAQEAYRIQGNAMELAERRARSTAMFLESGRAQTRDVLEAQEALVNAQSALNDALVSYYTAHWNLLRDTGELHVDPDGIWNLDQRN